MIIRSRKPQGIISTPIEEEKKVFEEVKVEVEEKTTTKKNKKNKEEEVILPLVKDDFSLIEEEYNS